MASNPAIAFRLQSTPPAGRVELGSLAFLPLFPKTNQNQ